MCTKEPGVGGDDVSDSGVEDFCTHDEHEGLGNIFRTDIPGLFGNHI